MFSGDISYSDSKQNLIFCQLEDFKNKDANLQYCVQRSTSRSLTEGWCLAVYMGASVDDIKAASRITGNKAAPRRSVCMLI